MTVSVEDRVPAGVPGLSAKKDGKAWAYNTKYNGLEDCALVIELGRGGASLAEMAAALGVGKITVQRWAQNSEEFDEALSHAKALSEAWWRQKGQEHLVLELNDKGKPAVLFNTVIWKTTLEHEHSALDDAARKDLAKTSEEEERVKALVDKIRAQEI